MQGSKAASRELQSGQEGRETRKLKGCKITLDVNVVAKGDSLSAGGTLTEPHDGGVTRGPMSFQQRETRDAKQRL